MEKRQKSTSYLKHSGTVPLGKGPAVKVWGYDPSEDFVCRLEINSAGIAVYSGEKGGKKLCDHSWRGLVKRLTKQSR
jgi:hypothetical protein